MQAAGCISSRPLSNLDTITEGNDEGEEIVMGAMRQGRRECWRRRKSRRKLETSAKDSAQKTIECDVSVRAEQPDRLLVSALKYWEVKRDLIEERLTAIRSATVQAR